MKVVMVTSARVSIGTPKIPARNIPTAAAANAYGAWLITRSGPTWTDVHELAMRSHFRLSQRHRRRLLMTIANTNIPANTSRIEWAPTATHATIMEVVRRAKIHLIWG